MNAAVVLITCGSTDEATRIAQTLVGERLAACVSIVPTVRSIYRWQGEVRRDEEVLLVVKTTEARLSSLTRRVSDLHSYEVPEVLALPVLGGSSRYMDWMASEVRDRVNGSEE